MCRNIRTLFNFDPPATDDEVRAASIQFVRKLSGFTKPSQANAAAFDQAIERVEIQLAAVVYRRHDSREQTREPRVVCFRRTGDFHSVADVVVCVAFSSQLSALGSNP